MRKPTRQELECTVTEGTTLLLHSAYSYSTDPKSTLLNLTEFHQYLVKRTVCIENKAYSLLRLVFYFEFVITLEQTVDLEELIDIYRCI